MDLFEAPWRKARHVEEEAEEKTEEKVEETEEKTEEKTELELMEAKHEKQLLQLEEKQRRELEHLQFRKKQKVAADGALPVGRLEGGSVREVVAPGPVPVAEYLGLFEPIVPTVLFPTTPRIRNNRVQYLSGRLEKSSKTCIFDPKNCL